MYTSTQQGTSGISSGSIDALRVQLMKMNAQQLQAFATANQDDAIKLSLAAEADKYKKQHGQEALALMSGQQQKPPIAQQILQSIGQPPQQQPMPPQDMPPQQMAQGQMPPQGMAGGGDVVVPEDQGIATLPVGNMDFAEGGIIGYADRGLVQGGTLVDQIEAANQVSLRNTGFPLSPAQRARLEQTIKSNIAQEAAARAAGAAGRPFNPSAPMFSTNRDKMEAEREQNMREVNRETVNLRPTSSADPRLLGATPPAETVQSAPTRTGGADVIPSRPNLVDPAIPQEGGLASLATKPEDLQRIYGNMVPPAADPFEGRIRAIGELEQANAARDLARRRQDIEDLGPAYKEREAKLQARQGRLEAEEGKLPYMAMLEAGLAMMGGTSPHAFVNIGAGGATGVKSYKQGIDKLTDAREKLDDAFGRIEEARRGEKVLNAKELRELENNVRNTVTKTEKDVLTGAQQAYGLSQQQAGKMFDAYIGNKRTELEQVEATKRSRYEQDQQNKRTAMTANAPTGLERILGNPVLFKRYMESQTGPANVRAESALRKEWAENPMVRQQYPKIDDYLTANGVGGQAGDGLKFLGSRPAQ
jgi:hypothetical protein